MVDPRQPVLVGVGRVIYREGDSPEPAELLAEAARRAATDAGGHGVLEAIGSVRVLSQMSGRYSDPAALVAGHLGIEVAHTMYTHQGGQMTQQLVHRTCDDIAAGKVDVALITGGEAWRTRHRLGESSPWEVHSDAQPSEMFGTELEHQASKEAELGLGIIESYALVEGAVAHHLRRTMEEQRRVSSEILARFSKVAAANPYAASRTPHTSDEIRTPAADNRWLSYPFTKLMVSNERVDQAGALLFSSVEKARALGIPSDRWVFLHGGGEGVERYHLCQRQDLAVSRPIAVAGRTALDFAGVGLDDIAHVDLYSCFPSAVNVAALALGLSVDRDLTVVGGLPYSGGPWNAYVVQSLAGMAEVLRADPGSYGLVSANGGNLTKHGIGVWSCSPPEAGTRWRSVQDELDASSIHREMSLDFDGEAELETYTVAYRRDGTRRRAWAFALTGEGRRALAVSEDPSLMQSLVERDVLGHAVKIRAETLLDVE
jgi:acetyl-CoA C-acetyltransferase